MQGCGVWQAACATGDSGWLGAADTEVPCKGPTGADAVLPAGVVKLRRGLTARIFDECDGMREVYVWFTVFLQELQEKALLHVDKTDPTREVSRRQR